ncbi:MAG: hypothetical protein IJ506_07225 [Clostridia bacterium]|nr:hypothetical protein [Clostridia bacterium]
MKRDRKILLSVLALACVATGAFGVSNLNVSASASATESTIPTLTEENPVEFKAGAAIRIDTVNTTVDKSESGIRFTAYVHESVKDNGLGMLILPCDIVDMYNDYVEAQQTASETAKDLIGWLSENDVTLDEVGGTFEAEDIWETTTTGTYEVKGGIYKMLADHYLDDYTAIAFYGAETARTYVSSDIEKSILRVADAALPDYAGGTEDDEEAIKALNAIRSHAVGYNTVEQALVRDVNYEHNSFEFNRDVLDKTGASASNLQVKQTVGDRDNVVIQKMTGNGTTYDENTAVQGNAMGRIAVAPSTGAVQNLNYYAVADVKLEHFQADGTLNSEGKSYFGFVLTGSDASGVTHNVGFRYDYNLGVFTNETSIYESKNVAVTDLVRVVDTENGWATTTFDFSDWNTVVINLVEYHKLGLTDATISFCNFTDFTADASYVNLYIDNYRYITPELLDYESDGKYYAADDGCTRLTMHTYNKELHTQHTGNGSTATFTTVLGDKNVVKFSTSLTEEARTYGNEAYYYGRCLSFDLTDIDVSNKYLLFDIFVPDDAWEGELTQTSVYKYLPNFELKKSSMSGWAKPAYAWDATLGGFGFDKAWAFFVDENMNKTVLKKGWNTVCIDPSQSSSLATNYLNGTLYLHIEIELPDGGNADGKELVAYYYDVRIKNKE